MRPRSIHKSTIVALVLAAVLCPAGALAAATTGGGATHAKHAKKAKLAGALEKQCQAENPADDTAALKACARAKLVTLKKACRQAHPAASRKALRKCVRAGIGGAGGTKG